MKTRMCEQCGNDFCGGGVKLTGTTLGYFFAGTLFCSHQCCREFVDGFLNQPSDRSERQTERRQLGASV